jgi:thioredoxin-related protein
MFKKIVLTFLLLGVSLIASEIKWAKDYSAGIKQASAQNKPILFISSRHSCKWCVVLDKTTLKDPKVIKALNDDFVSIISYSDENDFLPRKLYSPGTPAIWFLLPNGEPMYQPIPGAIKPEKMLQALGIVKKEFDAKKVLK